MGFVAVVVFVVVVVGVVRWWVPRRSRAVPGVPGPRRRRGRYAGITCFAGLPGSGKSYSLAEVGWREYQAGRAVWCNKGFDFVPSVAHGWVYSSFEELCAIPEGAVILLDEAPLYFNSRKWADFPEGFWYQLSQIRKDAKRFYFTAISLSMVDIQLRNMTFNVYACRSLTGRLCQKVKLPVKKGAVVEPERTSPNPFAGLFRVKLAIASLYGSWSKVAVPTFAVTARDSQVWGDGVTSQPPPVDPVTGRVSLAAVTEWRKALNGEEPSATKERKHAKKGKGHPLLTSGLSYQAPITAALDDTTISD